MRKPAITIGVEFTSCKTLPKFWYSKIEGIATDMKPAAILAGASYLSDIKPATTPPNRARTSNRIHKFPAFSTGMTSPPITAIEIDEPIFNGLENFRRRKKSMGLA
jgi:hypothetical protein